MLKNFTIFFFSRFSSLFCVMPEPYASINVLPFDEHGFFYNANELETVIDQVKPEVIIEIGSWLGSSTRFLAAKLPTNGKLFAVDSWAGSTNEALHMQDPRLPYLYQQFLSNVVHANLTDIIIPIRMKSIEAAKALNVQADLIYLDGAHDTRSVKEDILAWYPHLKEKGIMCGDDWSWRTVRKAVENCAKELNVKVVSKKNFWMYVK